MSELEASKSDNSKTKINQKSGTEKVAKVSEHFGETNTTPLSSRTPNATSENQFDVSPEGMLAGNLPTFVNLSNKTTKENTQQAYFSMEVLNQSLQMLAAEQKRTSDLMLSMLEEMRRSREAAQVNATAERYIQTPNVMPNTVPGNMYNMPPMPQSKSSSTWFHTYTSIYCFASVLTKPG